MINQSRIIKLEKTINYKFKNIQNLKNCLIHPSYLKTKKNYDIKLINEFERLEFLGDRVLGLVISKLIFQKYKKFDEGDLSKKLSYFVRKDFLYKLAIDINYDKILLYNYPKNKNIKLNKSILSDSIESLIGSIFEDGGYFRAFQFIKKLWLPYFNEEIVEDIDPKTKLQEITQQKFGLLPKYSLIKREGPSHSPKFTISLDAMNYKNIISVGHSIKEAEKIAAKKILELINEK